ncbi:hypothetical protein [Okeania sp. KiyG1]|uniref:hypothetical protein n=1 Tax=Okeania sp. KiyG1 TaxID=2720165 RepID=UPI001921E52C|nr:hypothetical protein [Okeania sp. KiyG1]
MTTITACQTLLYFFLVFSVTPSAHYSGFHKGRLQNFMPSDFTALFKLVNHIAITKTKAIAKSIKRSPQLVCTMYTVFA